MLPSDRDPRTQGVPAGRLADIEAVTDAALSRLDEYALLNALVERVKEVLRADTAAVLLLDHSAQQLIATAASGIEEEVRQGVRIPLGTGFAGRVAASREPVILTRVDHTTVRNPLLVDRGIRSLLGVPLLVGGKVIGVVSALPGEGKTTVAAGFAAFVANTWGRPAKITVSRDGQDYNVTQFGRIPKGIKPNNTYDPIPATGLRPNEVAVPSDPTREYPEELGSITMPSALVPVPAVEPK